MKTLSMGLPFSQRDGSFRLDSGVCAADSVNADNAKYVDRAIVADIVGWNVIDGAFTKADQIVTI